MVLLRPILASARKSSGLWGFARFVVLMLLSITFSLSLGIIPVSAAELIASGPTSGANSRLPVLSPLTTSQTVGVAGGSAFHFSGKRPSSLGVSDGVLVDCPETPNCVSSQAADTAHRIEPLEYRDSEVSAEQMMQVLKQIIDDSERAEVLRAEDGYLYAEFTSRLMGFVDDVEFFFNLETPQIEVRSASRLGESDLGINRQRIESIREQLKTLLNGSETNL